MSASEAPGLPPSDGERTVSLRIPAKAEYIALCRLALTGLSRLQHFGEEVLEDLKLALTEACTNSVRHAYQEGTHGTVEIIYDLHPDRLVVEVTDEGEGFTPPADAEMPDELSEEGGLGIAIIRALADEFELSGREGGQGSRLRFVKLLSE